MPTGAITAGSPTAEDVKQDERADLGASPALESSTSNDDNPASSAEPSNDHGVVGAEKPDASTKAETPLDKLRNRKVGSDAAPASDAPEPEAIETGEEPAVVAESKDEQPAAAAENAAGDAPAKDQAAAGKPAAAAPKPGDEPSDDALAGLSPEARKHIGREASVRIRELNGKWRTEEKARKADEPLVRGGRILQRYLTDREVPMTPQETIAALEFAKLYKRGDPAALDALRDSVAEIEERLGVQKTPAADEMQPFEGELPQSMQNLIDYGAEESEVRLLHAVRVRRAERERAAKAGTPAPAQSAPRPSPLRPAAQPQPQRQPAAQPQVNAYGHSLVAAAAAGDAVVSFLQSQGIAPGPAMEKYFDEEITPRIAKYAQHGNLESIAPEDRLRLVTIARQSAVIEKRQREAAQRDRARPVSGGTSPTPQTPTTQRAAANPLAALKAKKVGR